MWAVRREVSVSCSPLKVSGEMQGSEAPTLTTTSSSVSGVLLVSHHSPNSSMTSPSSPNPLEPPSYVLVSHSLTAPSAAGPSTTLSHATIEYHYADDSPHDLLPRTPGEHVLVLDYDPAHVPAPTAQSLSPDLAVKGVKVADAPGAGVAAEEGPRNNKIYVIETSVTPMQSYVINSILGVESHIISVWVRTNNKQRRLS